jgi:hypothetical protein
MPAGLLLLPLTAVAQLLVLLLLLLLKCTERW